MQVRFQSAVGKLVKAAVIVFNVVMVLLFSAKIVMDRYITVNMAFVFLIIDIIYIIPLIRLTYYEFKDDYLLIHDFPFRKFKIKYIDIFNVEDGDFETKNSSTVGLSYDRIAVGYRKYLSDDEDDYVERYIYISPRDMNLFLIRMSARLQQNKIHLEEKAKKISLKQQEHQLKKKLAEEKKAKEEKENAPEIIKVSGSRKPLKFRHEEVGESDRDEDTKKAEAEDDKKDEDSEAEKSE